MWKQVTFQVLGGGSIRECSSGLLTPLLFLLYNIYHTVTKAYTSLKTLLKEPSSRKSLGSHDLL